MEGRTVSGVDGMDEGFAVFETVFGYCALVWCGEVVVGSQLPEATADRAREAVHARFPGAGEQPPPGKIQQAILGVTALLRGERTDLSGVPLALDRVPPFHRRVYEVTLAIPAGSTMTYGQVATELGDPGSARAVGQALGNNPFAPIVPCHRVLAAGGKAGGFSATGGLDTKRRLLDAEGYHLEEPTLFDL
ncbi:methylated-DNA-[protein]-cysteine S-methyltransferase [Prauserella marina]|uniref:Methylated-DNA-[protein]-cysteine S-methyltransferase n=2 Tax=Prauserella marina TaxID=530584 RepID=A0A1G6ZJR4_9PSEU|nr:methylated-DNA-[protein]-cysteine S-methyltransferase [Prauserella marina]SDE02780.1 methylated-DNA-[protein]-cysteine S-methyltransferase [Prauserella marina]